MKLPDSSSRRLLFVNPNARSNRDLPNLSIAYAATHFKTKVIDLNTKPYPRNRFLDQKVDILGISLQSRTFSEALRIKNLYKSKYLKTKVSSIKTCIDVQCCYPFMKLEDEIVFNKQFSDYIPFPDFELFDSFNIFQKKWQSGEWNYPILTSLGCPYRCIYCSAHNRKWMPRSAENCVEELKEAKQKWKIKNFEVLDDCFNLNKERVIKFCENVEPLKLRWACVNGLRADRFDEDVARAMAKSGCFYVGFGIESIDPEILKTINKGETFEQIENAIDIAKKYFKRIAGFFIIGLPGSSYQKDLESLRWTMKKGLTGHFSFYVPFDKRTQYDVEGSPEEPIFHGEGAIPISEEYAKNLQIRIYKMTEAMRSVTKANLIQKLLTSLIYISVYDTVNLPRYILNGTKRIKERFL